MQIVVGAETTPTRSNTHLMTLKLEKIEVDLTKKEAGDFVNRILKGPSRCPDCLGYGGLDATDCGGPYIMCESCKGSGTREE